MTKLLKTALLSLFGLFFVGSAFALSPKDEDYNSLLHYSATDVTASTHVVLIDLSDTSTYLHDHRGSISISAIGVNLDKVTGSSGTIKLGVISSVDESSGTVRYFFELPFYDGDVGTVSFSENYSPSKIRTDVASDSPKQFVTNNSLLDDTAFQTDVNLPTGSGSDTAPGVGDIVLTLTREGTEILNYTVDVLYHANR